MIEKSFKQNSKQSFKLGLIGGGYWGKNLIRDFYSLNVLDTICDINPKSLKLYNELYTNIITTTKWDDIINNKSINAVCISLPAEMHYKFAKQALLADKDVYVEKPITLDLKEAEELVELAKNKNKILMVGHLLHYHPCIEKIKELVKNKEIGKIKHIISNRFNLGKFRTSENVLWSFAPHDISIILSLCNDELPDKIYCTGKDFLTKGIHDITNTILKYDEQNIYININVNWLNPYKEQKLVIIGENGMLLFDDTLSDNKLKLFKDYIKWSESIPSSIKNKGINIKYSKNKSPLLRECEHFISCCKNRTKPITDGEEGIRVLKVLQKSHECLLSNNLNKNYFAHDTAIIDKDANIGNNTKIWHFSHISNNSQIGNNCVIGQNVYIAPKSILGNGCKVQNNVSVYSGVECGDNVFLGPSCVFTNDLNPRAKYSKNGKYIKTIVKEGATIGANATIICGNTIGKHALIGAGAVVTKDVKDNSVVVGNPIRKIGTIDEFGNITKF